MADIYSKVIDSIYCQSIQPSEFRTSNSKSIYIVRDENLDSTAFVQALINCINTADALDVDKEIRKVDFDIRTMSVEELVEQSTNMKLINVQSGPSSRLCKTFDVPCGKDGGILVISDFKDFKAFNDSFTDNKQENYVWALLDFWHIIMLSSDTNIENEPDCCRLLHIKNIMDAGSYITVDGDSYTLPVQCLNQSNTIKASPVQKQVVSQHNKVVVDSEETSDGIDFVTDFDWDFEKEFNEMH